MATISLRRAAIAAAILVVIAITATLLVVRSSNQTQTPARSANSASKTAPSPGSSRPAELSWAEAGGVDLPVSRTTGPRVLKDGLASGYTQSPEGAAIAAVHLLVRAGPTVGPEIYEPTITAQATGVNVGALKINVAQQHEQLKVAGTRAAPGQLQGYIVRTFDSAQGAAVVDVVISAPDLPEAQRYLQVTVTLQWQSDDWRIVAPPNGDWATVSTPLSAPPAGILRYQDL